MNQLPGPNDELLEAQARVCTGPHQTRPLGVKDGDPQPARILELIVQSTRDELPFERRASTAQMGAYFTAMTIRRGFAAATGWSPAEAEAIRAWEGALRECLPPEVGFLLAPDGGYVPKGATGRVVQAFLRRILNGDHLDYDQTLTALRALIDGELPPAWGAALLIGQRMNLETYDEIRAYADATIDPADRLPVNVRSLTHFGQPYDGANRYLRPTLFVAAVRAAQGRATVLHGVDEMPPKSGVTEEAVLEQLGANTDVTVAQAAHLIEDPEVGFAHVSQRTYSPGAHALRELRTHIKKRPPWATTEKANRILTCPGSDHMVVGFYHAGYEDPLLRLMWEGGIQSGLVIKGEEGSSHYSLRLGQPTTPQRKAINFTQGFRRRGSTREDFVVDVNPLDFGFAYESSPRFQPMEAATVAGAGRRALAGEKGHVYDRIVFNAGLIDYWLGFFDDPEKAVAAAREAVETGGALLRLSNYVERS